MRCFLFFIGFYSFIGNVLAQSFIEETIVHDGNIRSYDLYVPNSYDGSVAFPLIFSFHGGSGTIADQQWIADMRPHADTANFIIVYPQALPDPNDNNSTNWLHKDPTNHDDVFFVEAMIDSISDEYIIDNNRIYACGYSLGGEFTYELACRLNHKIAAFSAVARTMQQFQYDNCNPVHPTGIQTILGTADSISPYNGLIWGGYTYYVSADDMHSYWVDYNNADNNAIVTAVDNINLNDGSSVDKRRWENGDNCVAVEELRVNNGGHDWPGSFGNMDIDATTEIWNFVSKYDLNGLIDCHNTSINQTNSNLRVFPNPVTDFLTIKSEISNHQTYSIYSILGVKLLDGTTSENKTINTSTLPSDIYILKIGTKNIKFLKL